MVPNFRNEARGALERARAELTSGDSRRIRYAALELRIAIEALTFDRAQSYKKEIPPEQYETWQPRKLLSMLLEIDPNADKTSSLRFGEEEKYGEPAKVMHSLGTDSVLGLATIKEHYDALGSYLHMPTLKQFSNQKSPNFDSLRERCNTIVNELTKVLSSPIWNVNFGNFAEFECQRCQNTIRKRIPHSSEKLIAKCVNCGADYTLTKETNDTTVWEPN